MFRNKTSKYILKYKVVPSHYRKNDWAPIKHKEGCFRLYVPLKYERMYFRRIPTEESVLGISGFQSDIEEQT